MEQQLSQVVENKRKYNTYFRKKLVTRFEKINNKEDFITIYNMIIDDIGNNFSSNRNGIFININLLSDSCIDKLIEFIDEKTNYSLTQSENEKNVYKSYKFDDVDAITELGHKLSSQEKTIIRRIRNNTISL